MCITIHKRHALALELLLHKLLMALPHQKALHSWEGIQPNFFYAFFPKWKVHFHSIPRHRETEGNFPFLPRYCGVALYIWPAKQIVLQLGKNLTSHCHFGMRTTHQPYADHAFVSDSKAYYLSSKDTSSHTTTNGLQNNNLIKEAQLNCCIQVTLPTWSSLMVKHFITVSDFKKKKRNCCRRYPQKDREQ